VLGFAEGRLLGWVLREGVCDGSDEGFVDSDGMADGYMNIWQIELGEGEE
jgi:hypothetical protein